MNLKKERLSEKKKVYIDQLSLGFVNWTFFLFFSILTNYIAFCKPILVKPEILR